MNKSLALIPVIFAIFALMLSPAVMSASASNGNGAGDKDNSQGCIKANEKSKACAQNPNASGSEPDLTCDGNKDGVMTTEEILSYLNTNDIFDVDAETLDDWIVDIESDEPPELNAVVGAIDNEIHELPELNLKLGDLATCTF